MLSIIRESHEYKMCIIELQIRTKFNDVGEQQTHKNAWVAITLGVLVTLHEVIKMQSDTYNYQLGSSERSSTIISCMFLQVEMENLP